MDGGIDGAGHLALRVIAGVAGFSLIVMSFFWSMRILMVRGTDPPLMARLVLRLVRNAMFALGLVVPARRRRQIWELYAPVGLLAIVAYTLLLVLIGYTLLFFGLSRDDLATSYLNSVSSLSVLGIGGLPDTNTLAQSTIALVEAFTGPILVALLITYIASMNSSLSQRQGELKAIELQVGRAESGTDLILRAMQGPGLATLAPLWGAWTKEFTWASTSFDTVEGYLLLFAPNMQRIWVTDTLMVLDAANLRNTLFDLPPDPVATDCLRSGAATIHLAASHFHRLVLPLRHAPPQAVSRDDFDQLYAALVAAEAPVVADQDAAWTRFAATQATYQAAVVQLSRLMNGSAPPPPASSAPPLTGGAATP